MTPDHGIPVGFLWDEGQWQMRCTGPDAHFMIQRIAQGRPWAVASSPAGADPRLALPGVVPPGEVPVPIDALRAAVHPGRQPAAGVITAYATLSARLDSAPSEPTPIAGAAAPGAR